MNSTYSEEEITTHTTTVLEEIEINVELGTITDTDKRYDVTPYAYWGNNGAVVVDFAARPQLAPPKPMRGQLERRLTPPDKHAPRSA